MILRARYMLTPGQPAIENGALRIGDDGRIVELGRKCDVSGAAVTDLGDSVVMPGSVNAHTHLELTHLAGRIPPQGDFVAWVARLVEAVAEDSIDPDRVAGAVRRGRDLSLTAGVTTVGDITRFPRLTRPALSAGPLRVVSFGEVIAVGALRGRLAARLADAADHLHESGYLRIGVSPHSTYTVEPDGIRACLERAGRDGLPVCMHLAESADEAEFTSGLAGALRGHLERLGVWDDAIPCPQASPIEYAASIGMLGPSAVLAHVNYATDQDLDRLASSGAHVAYCPRTHDAFGHPPHRFANMLDRGINVCIGTDSLASNPSLSVLEELRFLHRRYADVDTGVLLCMGTVNGARALGLADVAGSIAPGMQADLAVIPLDRHGPADPWENILRSEQQPDAIFVAGLAPQKEET